MLDKRQRFIVESIKNAVTLTLTIGGASGDVVLDNIVVRSDQVKLKHDIALAFQDAFNKINHV